MKPEPILYQQELSERCGIIASTAQAIDYRAETTRFPNHNGAFDTVTYVIRVKGKIISVAQGFVEIQPVPNEIEFLDFFEPMPSYYSRHVLYITHIWTEERHRRKGYATSCVRSLVSHFNNLANGKRIHSIYIHGTPDLKKFVERCFWLDDEESIHNNPYSLGSRAVTRFQVSVV